MLGRDLPTPDCLFHYRMSANMLESNPGLLQPFASEVKDTLTIRLCLVYFLVLMLSVLMAGDIVCRCVEVEDDGELARRKRIEEELSQALIRSFFSLLLSVLRIWDVYPGSRILIFTHPGSRIQKQQQKRGVKKFVFIPFNVATNFTKLNITGILVLNY